MISNEAVSSTAAGSTGAGSTGTSSTGTGSTATSGAIDLTNDASVAAVVSELVELNKEVTAQGVTLTATERRAALKMRTGAALVIPAVIDLATRYNVVLPNYTLAQMQSDLALYERLEPLGTATAALASSCASDQLATGSKVWGAALTIYGALQTLSARAPEIADELLLLQTFFAPKKASKTSSSTAGTGTGTATSGTGASSPSQAGPASNSGAVSAAGTVSTATSVAAQNRHRVVRHGDRRTAARANSRERRAVHAA